MPFPTFFPPTCYLAIFPPPRPGGGVIGRGQTEIYTPLAFMEVAE